MKYETPGESSSDSSESTEDETHGGKKRKLDMPKKKKMILKKQENVKNEDENVKMSMVEKHLEARNTMPLPSFTFPQEIFDEVDDI